MFLPGTPCGCCGGEPPCQPCPRCAPLCLTATFSGFAHGTENCNECSFLDDVTFQLKRPPDPTLSVTASVPSATGSGATFLVTTARSATDGSYAVTGIKLTNGGANYSLGDKVAFSSNGCITDQPEATITIATTQPQSKMNLPGVGSTDFLSLVTGGAVVPGVGGAVVPVTYQQQAAEDGSPYWIVASMGQPFAGAGYSAMQVVNLSPEAGVVVVEPATARITQVGGFGQPLAAELLAPGCYYKPGVITAVTLVGGGKIFGTNACEYVSDRVCSACPDNYGGTLQMSLSLGATNHTMTVVRRAANNAATTLLSGSRPSLDGEGNLIPCTDLTFDAEHFSGQYSCMTNGTVAIADGACGESSQGGCPVPDQVSISASGIPLILGHSSAFGGGTSGAYVPGLADHCGITGYCTISQSTGGGIGAAANISLVARDESGVIAEGGRNEACIIGYSGIMPDLPWGFVNNTFNWGTKDCGGSLSGVRNAVMSIGATTAFTNVTISPPSWGSYGATAEASVGGGQVTGVTITNPGEGYAREIFTRTEPDMTVTLSGGTGSGATLTATLTQSGTGESATWGVSSVSVTGGGTGYAGNVSVVFTPEEGATTDYPASAYIVTGRVEPTVTASVSGGSGASLSVTLGQSTDWNGLDIWSVSSVTVNNGGTGYTDGTGVTFTVTDGTQVYGASATISTVRSQPDVTASLPYSGGSGAVLTPSLSASGDSWTVSSVAITNGGSGYSQWDQVLISTGDIEASGSYLYVSSVDGTGAITGIGISQGGSYYRDTGVISSVNLPLYSGGEYYKSTGIIESVVVWEPGAYYLSESTGTSQVDTPTVTISSNAGEGATATATVDGTVGSETFGQITGISVTSGGSGYLAAVPMWQATLNYDGLAHASVSDRVTTDDCPTALLNRSYAMSLSVISLPGLFGNGCGNADAVTSNGNGTNTYRFDGITISVSAA